MQNMIQKTLCVPSQLRGIPEKKILKWQSATTELYSMWWIALREWQIPHNRLGKQHVKYLSKHGYWLGTTKWHFAGKRQGRESNISDLLWPTLDPHQSLLVNWVFTAKRVWMPPRPPLQSASISIVGRLAQLVSGRSIIDGQEAPAILGKHHSYVWPQRLERSRVAKDQELIKFCGKP